MILIRDEKAFYPFLFYKILKSINFFLKNKKYDIILKIDIKVVDYNEQ